MTQANTDISFLDAQADVAPVTARVAVVIDSDGEDVSGFIILSKDSPEFQAVQTQLRIEGVQKSAKRKSAIDASTDDGAKTFNRLVTANETRLALSVVTGWFGFTSNGADVPFDVAMVAKMFEKKPTWQAKVLAGLEAEANFIKG